MHSFAVRAAAIAGVAAVSSLLAFPSRVTAADIPVPTSTTTLSSGSLSGATGIVQINLSSGNENQQANVVSLNAPATAVTQSGPAAISHSAVLDRAIIEGGALHDVHGVIQINQVSGSNNVTANTLTLTRGAATTLAPADLGRLRPAGSGLTVAGAPAPRAVAEIAPGTFAGSNGVLQLTQVAGNGNRSQNDLTLTMAPAH